MKNTKSAVLACVTSQYNCDRIIRIAKEIADSSDCELRVMSVLKPMSDYSSVSDEIEYLYLIAKESGADVELCNVSEVTDVSGYDVVLMGCPAMGAEELEPDEFEPFFEANGKN